MPEKQKANEGRMNTGLKPPLGAEIKTWKVGDLRYMQYIVFPEGRKGILEKWSI